MPSFLPSWTLYSTVRLLALLCVVWLQPQAFKLWEEIGRQLPEAPPLQLPIFKPEAKPKVQVVSLWLWLGENSHHWGQCEVLNWPGLNHSQLQQNTQSKNEERCGSSRKRKMKQNKKQNWGFISEEEVNVGWKPRKATQPVSCKWKPRFATSY